MTQALKVLVAGTGFAGKGHTAGFRAGGADVIGMVGRTDHVVRDVAADLAIAYAGTDWQAALDALRPDIVAIATPGGAHYAPIKQAIAAGCHVFCDKPMTDSADTARHLLELARAADIKTAFAASFQFTPSVQHAKRLIAEGAIGHPTELESISHFNLERGIPFGWSHRAEDGGGRLNNNFTHSLAIAEALVGGTLTQVAGDVRDDLGRAPIVAGVHDFTKRRGLIPKDLNDPTLEWGESNVEWSYTVMGRIETPQASKPVSVLFKHGGLVPRFQDDHIVIYGTKGAIYLNGHYGTGALSLHDGTGWTNIQTPPDLAASIGEGLGDTEQCWHVLADRFLRDIRGDAVDPYPGFDVGARYQHVIDVIRTGEFLKDARDGSASLPSIRSDTGSI